MSGRYNAAAPAFREGIAHAGSVTVGSENKRGHVFGVRVTGLPNPPNVLGAETPRFAMGPSFVWEKHIRISPGMDLYPAGSAGILYGVSPDGTNVFLPTIQGGGGVRGTFDAGHRTRGFVAADFGMSITSLAPYAAVNVGMLIDPKP